MDTAGLDTAGWILLLGSWMTISVLVVFCIVRIMREDAPLSSRSPSGTRDESVR